MPKTTSASTWIKPYKELSMDMGKIYCSVCGKIVDTMIQHMKVVIQHTRCSGLWPLAFENEPSKRKLYRIFSWCVFILALIYVTTQFIQLYIMATHEQDIKTFTISACLTGTFSMALLKSRFINKELHLLEKIRARETRIYASKDEEIIKIYNNRANNINKFNLCYMIINYLDSVSYMYIFGPIFAPVETVYDSVKNTTHIHKQLPIESWMPFNVDEHFLKALFLEEFLSTFCMVLSFGSDIFFYGYIGYMVGQLEILNYILLNFETYKERVKQQLNCDDEKANYVTVQLCIKEHQIVLGYIDDYNNSMRTMMLLDFLHSSAQLAMISIIILLCVTDNLIKISGLGFAVILLCRLGIFYWLANDVIVKSFDLADAVYKIHWYQKSQRTKTLLKIFLFKCNQLTGLQIGQLSIMSWDIFFLILKTAYSYLTFVYKYKDEILG